MAKSYLEQLGEWVKQRKSTQRDKNLVAFLAVKEDVKAAVEAGYAVKTVWANMSDTRRVEFGYDTFLNFVNRLIRQQKTAATHHPGAEATTTNNQVVKKIDPKNQTITKPKPEKPAGFIFNSTPNKEELM